MIVWYKAAGRGSTAYGIATVIVAIVAADEQFSAPALDERGHGEPTSGSMLK